ncbi:hypothetical protein Nepgr_031845 [Nepenthes gracilis]|uniref:Myb-like domain-containing protein n=1 Tax=Nepenthes gracilis TaxID=150966 RepID=A0AAD3TJK2_NEPGR|nr:hypothetical protein Nepgr_031845 [Nepenthes gracilis]
MERRTHLHHHRYQQEQQQQQQQQQMSSVNVDTADRFPQWSFQETKEFLMIRAELDRSFMETKRNKLLWEVISTKLKEKGFNRSAEQCKCKWKNLVTRYKGCETMEPEAMKQQFPFYNELQAIFAARMQRMLWAEAEGAASGSKKKSGRLSSDDEEDEDSEGEKMSRSRKKKAKSGSTSTGGVTPGSSSRDTNIGVFKELLEDFMRQLLQMEMQWRDASEAREAERTRKEMEWRQEMQALENERLTMERRWREREEQRRIMEEVRAEKRDALMTELLNQLRKDDVD